MDHWSGLVLQLISGPVTTELVSAAAATYKYTALFLKGKAKDQKHQL